MKFSDLPVQNENYQKNKGNGEPAGTKIVTVIKAINAYESVPQGKMLNGQPKDATHSVDRVPVQETPSAVKMNGQVF